MCFHILPLFQSCLLIYQYYWCLNISVFFICIFIISLFVVVMCCVLNMLHPRKLLHIFFQKFNVLMSWVHRHVCERACVRACICMFVYSCISVSPNILYAFFFSARRKLLWLQLMHNKEVFQCNCYKREKVIDLCCLYSYMILNSNSGLLVIYNSIAIVTHSTLMSLKGLMLWAVVQKHFQHWLLSLRHIWLFSGCRDFTFYV